MYPRSRGPIRQDAGTRNSSKPLLRHKVHKTEHHCIASLYLHIFLLRSLGLAVWLLLVDFLSGSDDADGDKEDAQDGIGGGDEGPTFARAGAAFKVHESLPAPGEAVGLPAAGHPPEHAVDAAHAALAGAQFNRNILA